MNLVWAHRLYVSRSAPPFQRRNRHSAAIMSLCPWLASRYWDIDRLGTKARRSSTGARFGAIWKKSEVIRAYPARGQPASRRESFSATFRRIFAFPDGRALVQDKDFGLSLFRGRSPGDFSLSSSRRKYPINGVTRTETAVHAPSTIAIDIIEPLDLVIRGCCAS
jgi:hypothetical protein